MLKVFFLRKKFNTQCYFEVAHFYFEFSIVIIQLFYHLDNFDSEDDAEQAVPSHYFDIQPKKTKRNPDGYTASLIIPPFVFKRKNQYKDSAVFTCNSCDKAGVSTIANAKQTGEDENGFPKYELVAWPRSHKCAPSSNFHKVRENPRGDHLKFSKKFFITNNKMYTHKWHKK